MGFGDGYRARLARAGLWFGVSLLTMGQLACQSNPPASDPPPQTLTSKPEEAAKGTDAEIATPVALVFPKGLELKDLDASEQQVLHEILSEQYDPCGQSRSFLEALSDPKVCEQAKTLADLSVTKLAEGLSKRQVVQALLKEQARTANKASFDLTQAPFVGDPTSSKVLVEFYDYQCPHCRNVAGPAKELALKSGAVLYYKMMPLKHHAFARDAARYALAAQRQGKFQELHQLIFENQERLSLEVLEELAQSAQLDLKRLKEELAKTGPDSVDAIVDRDLAEADTANIDGTPTFYLNGYQVEYANLEKALNESAP